MGACHALDPGSIPGRRVFLFQNKVRLITQSTKRGNIRLHIASTENERCVVALIELLYHRSRFELTVSLWRYVG